jgi:hypothetical protein
MTDPVKYDTDLQQERGMYWLMLPLNAAGALLFGWLQQWTLLFAFLIFAANIVSRMVAIKAQQKTRDLVRLQEAALAALLDRQRC